MATFYVLPPRACLGALFADYLAELFPGLDWDEAALAPLADTLAGLAAGRPDVYVVFREELPAGEDTPTALADGYGAEPGDEVVFLRPDRRSGKVGAWRLVLGRAAGPEMVKTVAAADVRD